MFGLIRFLFPWRLARISYVVRATVADTVLFCYGPELLNETGIWTLIALVLYQFIFIILPRIRDIGMRPYWIILMLLPLADYFLSCALIFRRTNPRHNPFLRFPPTPPPVPAEPTSSR